MADASADSVMSAAASGAADPEAGSFSASDTETADMAAMMGFSSFGAKPNPPSKKRKLDEVAASRTGAGSGSGSNSMPLGKPRDQKEEADGGLGGFNKQQIEELKHHIQSVETVGKVESRKGEKAGGAMEGAGAISTSAVGSSTGLPAGKLQDNYDWQSLRRGRRTERGDVAYYDASFVEDPWKHLTA